mgnify:CR=1 FL=1
MLRMLGKGLLARLLAYAVFGLGFWLLFQGFMRPNILLGILGGAMIPVGVYLIVGARRGSNLAASITLEYEQKGELIDPVHDPIDRSR